jgi:hypothetical protein
LPYVAKKERMMNLARTQEIRPSQHAQDGPKPDFGFYTVIPRVVRTGYQGLTAAQKWLYVCLRDLCGEHGTCYRALRTLREETGMSLGMLSESIPALHKAGLIHAEKKRRSHNPTGKEVWHITIVDIWQKNGAAHPTQKGSQNEQQCSGGEQSPQNVHKMNKNVHHVNDSTQKCSRGEQQCSSGEQGQSCKAASHLVSSGQNEAGRKNNEARRY